MSNTIPPFVVEGTLALICQEGGFAVDAFELCPDEDIEIKPYFWMGQKQTTFSLDEAVAQHFDAVRDRFGDRPIGRVRITIESLDD